MSWVYVVIGQYGAALVVAILIFSSRYVLEGSSYQFLTEVTGSL